MKNFIYCLDRIRSFTLDELMYALLTAGFVIGYFLTMVAMLFAFAMIFLGTDIHDWTPFCIRRV